MVAATRALGSEICEPSALAAGLEVVVKYVKQSRLSAKSNKRRPHWLDGLQIEPPNFETRG